MATDRDQRARAGALTPSPDWLMARFRPWLVDWGVLWECPDLAEQVRFVLAPRLRRSLGRCHLGSGEVRLHPGLFEDGEPLLREVVCHEVAHRAAFLRFGARIRPHGPEWQSLMRAAGYPARATIEAERIPTAIRQKAAATRRYLHRCTRCDVQRLARRRMRRWRCRRCVDAGRSGQLEIRLLEAAGSSAHDR